MYVEHILVLLILIEITLFGGKMSDIFEVQKVLGKKFENGKVSEILQSL